MRRWVSRQMAPLAFPPVLGTGGNEGHLDYTNNFMSRIAALLIEPDSSLSAGDLLANALFASPDYIASKRRGRPVRSGPSRRAKSRTWNRA